MGETADSVRCLNKDRSSNKTALLAFLCRSLVNVSCDAASHPFLFSTFFFTVCWATLLDSRSVPGRLPVSVRLASVPMATFPRMAVKTTLSDYCVTSVEKDAVGKWGEGWSGRVCKTRACEDLKKKDRGYSGTL